jgi:YHS domain-containing protein
MRPSPTVNCLFFASRLSASNSQRPLCPVRGMDGDPSWKSVYKGKPYYFCSQNHKETFDKAPAAFANAA